MGKYIELTSKAQEQIQVMFHLQDVFNAALDPDWKQNKGMDWRRAIWVECAELMDHIGWKWWKEQKRNLKQAQIELVDILHFLLSETLIADDLEVLKGSLYIPGLKDPRDSVEGIVGSSMSDDVQEIWAYFICTMYSLDLGWDELFELYIGKNALNALRQINGYKTGDYLKTWWGEEDNVYLERIMENATGVKPEHLYNHVFAELERLYKLVL